MQQCWIINALNSIQIVHYSRNHIYRCATRTLWSLSAFWTIGVERGHPAAAVCCNAAVTPRLTQFASVHCPSPYLMRWFEISVTPQCLRTCSHLQAYVSTNSSHGWQAETGDCRYTKQRYRSCQRIPSTCTCNKAFSDMMISGDEPLVNTGLTSQTLRGTCHSIRYSWERGCRGCHVRLVNVRVKRNACPASVPYIIDTYVY